MNEDESKCPGCSYDLRGKAIESAFCPECGAYLSFLDSDAKGFIPPLVLFRTLSQEDHRILVRNATFFVVSVAGRYRS